MKVKDVLGKIDVTGKDRHKTICIWTYDDDAEDGDILKQARVEKMEKLKDFYEKDVAEVDYTSLDIRIAR